MPASIKVGLLQSLPPDSSYSSVIVVRSRWRVGDGELGQGNHCDGHPHDLGATNALPGERCAVEITNKEQMENFHHD